MENFTESRLRAISATRPTGPWDTMTPETIEVHGTMIVQNNDLCAGHFYAFVHGKWHFTPIHFREVITHQMRLAPKGKDPKLGLHLLTLNQDQFDLMLQNEAPATEVDLDILGFFHYTNRKRFDRPCAPYNWKSTKQRLAQGRLACEKRYKWKYHG